MNYLHEQDLLSVVFAVKGHSVIVNSFHENSAYPLPTMAAVWSTLTLNDKQKQVTNTKFNFK